MANLKSVIVDNNLRDSYRPAVYEVTDSDGKPAKVQVLTLVDSSGSEVGSINPMVTFTPSQATLTNNTSVEAIASNSSRKAGSYLQNNTSATLYGNYGASATLNQGFKISPGQAFTFNTTQAIHLIQNSGGDVDIDIFEAT